MRLDIFEASTTKMGRISRTSSALQPLRLQLNNFVYFGIGAGIDSYRHNENCYISVPLFADLRVNCLNDKRVMPFFDIRMGYSMGRPRTRFLLGRTSWA